MFVFYAKRKQWANRFRGECRPRQFYQRVLQCDVEVAMKLKVLVRAESVGGYSVSVPALPGCHSEGDTLEEALANIREAAELWLEATADAWNATHYKRRPDGR